MICFENSQIESLRALRLWHWRQAIRNQDYAKANLKVNMLYWHDVLMLEADINLSFVHDLNAFFPVDDTADKDAIK